MRLFKPRCFCCSCWYFSSVPICIPSKRKGISHSSEGVWCGGSKLETSVWWNKISWGWWLCWFYLLVYVFFVGQLPGVATMFFVFLVFLRFFNWLFQVFTSGSWSCFRFEITRKFGFGENFGQLHGFGNCSWGWCELRGVKKIVTYRNSLRLHRKVLTFELTFPTQNWRFLEL